MTSGQGTRARKRGSFEVIVASVWKAVKDRVTCVRFSADFGSSPRKEASLETM